mmetsp:Transcript_3582/g.13104  ORF Transcript_3582/g.13104 Transcript_3582/m.13104 type:complete len:204 (-) Transcript_3582:84-695(-)
MCQSSRLRPSMKGWSRSPDFLDQAPTGSLRPGPRSRAPTGTTAARRGRPATSRALRQAHPTASPAPRRGRRRPTGAGREGAAGEEVAAVGAPPVQAAVARPVRGARGETRAPRTTTTRRLHRTSSGAATPRSSETSLPIRSARIGSWRAARGSIGRARVSRRGTKLGATNGPWLTLDYNEPVLSLSCRRVGCLDQESARTPAM